jgi:hypothetical protein
LAGGSGHSVEAPVLQSETANHHEIDGYLAAEQPSDWPDCVFAAKVTTDAAPNV